MVFAARILKVFQRNRETIDSLADLVSFGVFCPGFYSFRNGGGAIPAGSGCPYFTLISAFYYRLSIGKIQIGYPPSDQFHWITYTANDYLLALYLSSYFVPQIGVLAQHSFLF